VSACPSSAGLTVHSNSYRQDEIDPDVFDALPPDVQAELHAAGLGRPSKRAKTTIADFFG
jgi:hypothetical protein